MLIESIVIGISGIVRGNGIPFVKIICRYKELITTETGMPNPDATVDDMTGCLEYRNWDCLFALKSS